MLSHDHARLDDPKVPEDRELMALIGYGSYDSEAHKPRDAEIFDEYFETLSPKGHRSTKSQRRLMRELSCAWTKRAIGEFTTWVLSVTGFPKFTMTRTPLMKSITSYDGGCVTEQPNAPGHVILITIGPGSFTRCRFLHGRMVT